MYSGYKVKVFIFAGRQQTMELLMPQLQNDLIDEIIIAKNTTNANDLRYLATLENTYDKIHYIDLPPAVMRERHTAWKYLYNFMQDEDSIYFKMDDDVIFIEPGYFEKTLEFKVKHPEILCVFPMIVNNPYCCTLLKEHPLMFSKFDNYRLMFEYFYSGKYGAKLHELFLMDPMNERWKIENHVFGAEHVCFKNNNARVISKLVDWYEAERIAINAICYFGKDFKELNVAAKMQNNYSDELFLTYDIFQYTDKKHMVLGDTLVSHYAFSGQRGLRERIDILDAYKKLISKQYQTKPVKKTQPQ